MLVIVAGTRTTNWVFSRNFMGDAVNSTAKTPLPLILASFVILVAGMKAASPILVPFLLAVFIAVICAPPLFWLRSKGVPKILALVLILVIILALGFFLGALIGSSLNQFLRSLPGYQEQLATGIASTIEQLHKKGIQIPAEELSGALHPGWVMNLAGDIFSALSTVFTNALLILITVVFILLEVAELPVKLRVAFKDPERSLSTMEQFSRNAQNYLVIKTLISAATGIAIWLWLILLGVDYPLLWGTLAFLLNYVPNVGSVIAALPPFLIALLTLGPASAILALVGIAVINVVFGYLLEPKLMGRRLRLSTLVVFLSLVFWGWVLGPLGMILSVPMTSLVVIALESYDKTRKFSVLMGSGPESVRIKELRRPGK